MNNIQSPIWWVHICGKTYPRGWPIGPPKHQALSDPVLNQHQLGKKETVSKAAKILKYFRFAAHNHCKSALIGLTPMNEHHSEYNNVCMSHDIEMFTYWLDGDYNPIDTWETIIRCGCALIFGIFMFVIIAMMSPLNHNGGLWLQFTKRTFKSWRGVDN